MKREEIAALLPLKESFDLLEKPVRHKILYSFYLQKALELE